MELFIILGVAVAVALIWSAARPKSRRPERRSGPPRLWHAAPGTDATSGFSLWAVTESGASDLSAAHSHHDGGHHSSTNAPPDIGAGGDSAGGGGDGGGGDGDGGGQC